MNIGDHGKSHITRGLFENFMNLFAFMFFGICLIIYVIVSAVANVFFQGYAASESDTHKTATSDFNFVVAGDFSCNKEAKKTVNNMATKNQRLF